MTIQKTTNGDIEIAFDATGPVGGCPLLLAMGIGGQLLSWPEPFCELLVDRGFRVARFDNRDAGLSTRLSRHGTPGTLRMLLRPASAAVYRLEDMADDAAAVLDALGWESAHVAGMSEGGMIAQTLAIRYPDRVRSLTAMSSAPSPRVGRPGPMTLARIIRAANPARVRSREDFVRYSVGLHRMVGSPAYPTDEESLREHARRVYDRGGLDMGSVRRQTAAMVASGDRRPQLAGLSLPTLVLHGAADPLIGLAAARATAAAVPGARLVTYPGMGHDLPSQLWSSIVDEIADLARAAGDGAALVPARPEPVAGGVADDAG